VPYCQVFAGRIENQLIGADGLEVRGNVDAANERIVQAMFECLQQMAKMDGGEGQAAEDKGQLNYHVIMIGKFFSIWLRQTAEVGVLQRICITLPRRFIRSSSGRCRASSGERRRYMMRTLVLT
jgi:hypothetical protein